MMRSRGYLHFAWKRFLRIFPAFILSLLLVYVLGGSVYGALVDWVSLFAGVPSTEVNPPLWSLSVEEVLYASLAVLFAFGVYATRLRAFSVLISLVILSVCLSRYFNSYQLRFYQVALCFICGSLLYLFRDKIWWSTGGGFFCLGLSYVLRNLGLNEILYSSVIGLPVAYGVVSIAFYSRPLFASFKEKVGDPCFGIYIYHYPILLSFYSLGVSGFWLLLCTLIVTLIAALLSWHLIEKRALMLKDWRANKVGYTS